MIRFSREKVLLLHQLLAQENMEAGLGVASGTMGYPMLLDWIRKHKA